MADSTKPEGIAKLNVYELIRTQLQANPAWKVAELLKHFKNDTNFKAMATQAGTTPGKKLYRAAIKWIGLNPIVNT